MANVKDVEIILENSVWYVIYVEDDVLKKSEPFITEENAITFSLNLKFI